MVTESCARDSIRADAEEDGWGAVWGDIEVNVWDDAQINVWVGVWRDVDNIRVEIMLDVYERSQKGGR